MTRLTVLARRLRRHPLRIWLLWAVGALALLSVPFAFVEPGVWVLLVDPELVAVLVVSGLLYFQSSVRHTLALVVAGSTRRLAALRRLRRR